jgi:signal transduction histidine kinase
LGNYECPWTIQRWRLCSIEDYHGRWGRCVKGHTNSAGNADIPETAIDAVIGVDGAGRVTAFNPAAEQLFGHHRAEVLGKLLADVVGGKSRLDLEQENRRLQGTFRMKSEFLANMSHELRTPLNAIMGFSELMLKGKVGPVSDDHKEYLGDILDSARTLLTLINDVLDMAKVESGEMEFRREAVDLGKLAAEIGDILGGFASSRRIRIRTKVDASLGTAVLDPAKLKQLLYGYVSNAVKFSREEGVVTIHVLSEEHDRVRIEVEDTGIGIRREDTHRLFVEFQQLDPGIARMYAGTGLGLALAKRIVEAQGGSVGARSEPGKGSTFWAVLPRNGGSPLPRAMMAQPPSPPTGVAVETTGAGVTVGLAIDADTVPETIVPHRVLQETSR